MKKFLPVLAVLSSTAMAADYKINLDARLDFSNSTTKNSAGTSAASETKANGFSTSVVRANLFAKINDDLSMRFRYRFNFIANDVAASKTTGNRDGFDNHLDFAYIDHKNSLFTTRWGKQKWDEAYGRESFLSASDYLVTSKVKSNFGTAIGEYRMGASALVKFMDTHNLALAISNPNTSLVDTTGDTKNNGLAYGVYYNSSLMNKMIQPTLAYTTATQDADEQATPALAKKNNTLWAAGLRSEVVGAVIDVDYKELKVPSRSTTTYEEKTKSMYTNVAYAIDAWTPFATYIHDKYTKAQGDNKKDYKRDAMAFGVMFKPYAENNFRYHLAYTSDVTKYDAGALATNAKVDSSSIVFGVKADL